MKDICRAELKNLKAYVPGKPISEVKRELKIREIVKLASNESPYPPFPEAIAAMEKVLLEGNRYPDSNCFLLKEELSHFLNAPTENLLVGNGSNELVRLIAQAVLDPGEKAVMASPSFVVYPTVTKMMGGVCVEIPLREYRHDLSAMLEAVDERTKLVFVCNPNNPTGTIVKRKELDEFMRRIPEDVVVVLDEAYFEYVEDKRYPNGLDYFRQGRLVVVLRTFSKIYSLAGCRIGYGVAPEFLVQAISKIKEPFNVNAVAQAGALASLDCQGEANKRRRLNSENKRRLYKQLKGLKVGYVPSEANFILVDVGVSSKEIFERLLREGVIVRSGDVFGYDTCIRVTIGTREENDKFIEALEKVLQ